MTIRFPPPASGGVSGLIAGGSVSGLIAGGSVSGLIAGAGVSGQIAGGGVSGLIAGGGVSGLIAGGDVSGLIADGDVSGLISVGVGAVWAENCTLYIWFCMFEISSFIPFSSWPNCCCTNDGNTASGLLFISATSFRSALSSSFR